MTTESRTSNQQLYYMQVRGYSGNSLLWWKKGRHGYTEDIQQAHVFTHDEAMRQHKMRPTEDFPWRKEYIDAHVQLHVHVETISPGEGRAA